MNTELSVAPQQPTPTPATMLQAVIEKGIGPENVAVLEKLMQLYERVQEREAERAFTQAFNALQADLPQIVASTEIPNRGRYEKFEDVMRVVGPLLVKHGFAVSFSMDAKDGRVLETCHLRHIGGHSHSNSFAVRTGKADTETQADCKAATTAKRNALLNALNIVIRQDAFQSEDDAAIEGALIGPDKVQFLKEECADRGVNVPKFLEMAGVKTFEEIRAGSYPVLVRSLAMKRKGA